MPKSGVPGAETGEPLPIRHTGLPPYVRTWLDNQTQGGAVPLLADIHSFGHVVAAGEVCRVQKGSGPGNAGPAKR